jgi:N-carbamoylputrescine amidase
MQPIRIALVQLAWLGSREAMQTQYQAMIAEAAAGGARLICLPEFSLAPYFASSTDPAGFAWAETLNGGVTDAFFGGLAREHGVFIISSLFEHAPDEQYFDTAIIHNPHGDLLGITRKVHIPYGDGYNETSFFGGGADYPVHDLGELRLAAPTCYDQWFPEMARICAMNGAEFIFYPTAIGSEPSDPTMDSQEMWETVMRGHAIANGVFVAAANRIGAEPPLTFYGSSFVCDPMGKILAKAGRDTTEVIYADLDPQVFEHWRDLFPLLKQRVPHTYQRILDVYESR